MTLRRYTPLKPSVGARIPDTLRRYIHERDGSCVLRIIGYPHDCSPGYEIDHVRASGALGRKSPTVPENLVLLCPNAHRLKTRNGRELRPILLAYLRVAEPGASEHTHVEPVFACPACDALWSMRRAGG